MGSSSLVAEVESTAEAGRAESPGVGGVAKSAMEFSAFMEVTTPAEG